MVKRAVFEQAGRFSEEYFMYVEDLDLSYEITRAGHKIHYLNGVTVTHDGGKSSGKQELISPVFASVRPCYSSSAKPEDVCIAECIAEPLDCRLP